MIYWSSGQFWRANELFDAWTGVALVVAIAMVHGVYRLWRGMRLDGFERAIRSLRQRPETTRLEFPKSRRAVSQARGFQISLLPLMLVSGGLALLLAQAQRPDDVSRPATWLLFLTIGAWCGSRAWARRRGVGPLRNESLAAIASTTAISVLLWGFYLMVDVFHQDSGYQRLTTSVPVLLWWTSVGAAIGGLIGSLRASRIYLRSAVRQQTTVMELAPDDPLPTPDSARKLRWRTPHGAFGLACLASLVIHLSAVPQIFHSINYRYLWTYHSHYAHWNHNALTLTMAPAPAAAKPWIASQTLGTQENSIRIDGDGPALLPPWNGPAPSSEPPRVSPPPTPLPTPVLNYVDVFVAKQMLKEGVKLEPSMFRTLGLNAEAVPANAVVDIDVVVGKYASVNIPAERMLNNADVAESAESTKIAIAQDTTEREVGPSVDLSKIGQFVIDEPNGPNQTTQPIQQTRPGIITGDFDDDGEPDVLLSNLLAISGASLALDGEATSKINLVVFSVDGQVFEGKIVSQSGNVLVIQVDGQDQPITLSLTQIEKMALNAKKTNFNTSPFAASTPDASLRATDAEARNDASADVPANAKVPKIPTPQRENLDEKPRSSDPSVKGASNGGPVRRAIY